MQRNYNNLSQSVDQPALYIHIPFCERKCPYCSFYSEPVSRHQPSRLLAAILLELERYQPLQPRTMYIGGGSPSCLSMTDLELFLTRLTEMVNPACEFTVEINPGQADVDMLKLFLDVGVNRLSVGAQSFRQADLDVLGRPDPVEAIYSTIDTAHHCGFENISLDLMFAVPGSTVQSWQANLERAMELPITHISAYSLTYEEKTPFYRQLNKKTLIQIDEEIDRAMYETTMDTLAAAGFFQYEISNFARSEFFCQHNLTYWANESFIGLGPGAASWLNHTRSHNLSDINGYIDAVEHNRSPVSESYILGARQRACETAILNLRRIKGIDLSGFKRQTGYAVLEMFASQIEYYIMLKLLHLTDTHLCLTREALPIADSILCDFVDDDPIA